MNVSTLEMTQASLEFFGALVCLMSVILIYFNKSRKKTLRYFIYFFAIGFLLFMFEGLAYIFRGNVNTISLFMTRICNFGVFVLDVLLMVTFIRFIYRLVEAVGVNIHFGFKLAVDICSGLILLILMINIFTGWMYYFDNDNYYHRSYMFYVYSAMVFIIAGISLFVAIKYFKKLGTRTAVMIIIFTCCPSVALLINQFLYGFAITNFGIGISLIAMLIIFLRDWSKKENGIDVVSKRKKGLETIILFIIMTLSMAASIVSCIISIEEMAKTSSKHESLATAEMIATDLENALLEPIVVSKTMSNDQAIIDLLERSKNEGATAVEADIQAYLSSICKGFGYQQAFVACDANKAYYITSGLNKYLDIENDEHDIWYKEFMASNRDIEFNLDTDEGNSLKLGVFVNKKIRDNNGKVIGAIGVAANLEDFIELIEKYESDYNIKIELVDSHGIVQISSSKDSIEVGTVVLPSAVSGKYNYSLDDDKATLAKYMSTFNWYIIITDYEPIKVNTFAMTTVPVIVFLAGIVLLALAFSIISFRERRTYSELLDKKHLAVTDEMTGLYNRRAYNDDLKILEPNKDKYIVMLLDINGLKETNDTLGHEAGDELIMDFSKLLLNIYNLSKCYRIGGDEFVVITEASEADVLDSFVTLKHLTKSHRGKYINEISFSKGYVIAKEHSDESLSQMIDLADKKMYEEKTEYYKTHDRRAR